MKRIFYAEALVFTLIVTWIANDFQMFYQHPTLLWLCLPLVVAIVAVAGFFKRGIQSKRLRICYHGGCLLSMFARAVLREERQDTFLRCDRSCSCYRCSILLEQVHPPA